MKKIVSIAVILFASRATFAESIVDIEYIPSANGYSNAYGIGAYQLKEEGLGFYGNIATTLASRKPMYESLTVTSFGDPVTARYKDLTVFNLGLTRKFNSNFAGYVGGGYVSAKGVAQKYDPMRILDASGTYYVNDPVNDKSGGNVNAGLMAIFGTIGFNVGYNSFLSAAYVGVGLKY